MPENTNEGAGRVFIPQRTAWDEQVGYHRESKAQIEVTLGWLKRYDRLGAGLGLRGSLLLLVDALFAAVLLILAGTQPLPLDFWGLATILLFVLAALLLGLAVLMAGGAMLPDWKLRLPGMAGMPADPDPPALDSQFPCTTRMENLQEIQSAVRRARGMYQLQQRFLSLGLVSLLVASGIIALMALVMWIA